MARTPRGKARPSAGIRLRPGAGGRLWRLDVGSAGGAMGADLAAILAGNDLLGEGMVGLPTTVAPGRFDLRLAAPRPAFLHRFLHPALRLLPGAYRLAAPSRLLPLGGAGQTIDIIESSPPEGLVAFLQGEVAAVRLTEAEVLDSRLRPEEVLCVEGVRRYHLFIRRAPPGSPPDIRPERLAARVARATGRPLAGFEAFPLVEHADPWTVVLQGTRPAVLADAEDAVGIALADQLQADLLDAGVHVEIRATGGAAFDQGLKDADMALVGFRDVFFDPVLDLDARVRALGMRSGALEALLHAAAGAGGKARARLAAAAGERLAPSLFPLLEVSECWAFRAPADDEMLARVSGHPVALFRRRSEKR